VLWIRIRLDFALLNPESEMRIWIQIWIQEQEIDQNQQINPAFQNRVGKNPVFFKKTQPSGFFWVFLGFMGFFGFFAQTRGFLGLFSV
jgi:hypothetical protein